MCRLLIIVLFLDIIWEPRRKWGMRSQGKKITPGAQCGMPGGAQGVMQVVGAGGKRKPRAVKRGSSREMQGAARFARRGADREGSRFPIG
jgi:hypothetical protein